MKHLLLFVLLISTTVAFSQSKKKVKIKVDRKNDMVTVDGQPYFKYVNKTGGLEVLNMNDEEIAYFDITCYQDYKAVSESNPKGNVCYKTIHFNGIDDPTEIPSYGPKGIAKIFLDHGIYIDGKLDIEATLKYIKRNGMKHSAEQLK